MPYYTKEEVKDSRLWRNVRPYMYEKEADELMKLLTGGYPEVSLEHIDANIDVDDLDSAFIWMYSPPNEDFWYNIWARQCDGKRVPMAIDDLFDSEE